MKNTKFNSKKFATPVRMSTKQTNMSPKAVSKVSKAPAGATAGKRMEVKTFKAKRVIQTSPAQKSKNPQAALTKKPSMNAKKQSTQMAGTRLPKSYGSIHKSVKKTMGY